MSCINFKIVQVERDRSNELKNIDYLKATETIQISHYFSNVYIQLMQLKNKERIEKNGDNKTIKLAII